MSPADKLLGLLQSDDMIIVRGGEAASRIRPQPVPVARAGSINDNERNPRKLLHSLIARGKRRQ
jgi:hypothetical protein